MKAGDLRERITIKTPTTTIGSKGQDLEGTPTTLATVWAAKWNLSTKDVTRQAGIAEQASAKFLIRYRADITTSQTVEYRGQTYKVIGTEDYENRVGLFLFVRSIDD